jgi:hypothetical protein
MVISLFGCAGYRAVPETGSTTSPGKMLVTNAPKPKPVVMAEGKLVEANVTTATFGGTFYYTWQLRFQSGRTVPFRTVDVYTFDEGQNYRVTLDPESKVISVRQIK